METSMGILDGKVALVVGEHSEKGGRLRSVSRPRERSSSWRGILLTYLPAFFAAGVACVVAALLVLTIGKRSTAATVAR
jgi:hypothetical protein